MNIKLSEERYNALKLEVSKARILLNIDEMDASKKEKKVLEYVSTLKIENDEEKQFYIANFLIPNDQEFYDCYIKNSKNLKKTADAYGIPTKYVIARIFELGKYQEYMIKSSDKKGDKMSNVEIIDDGFSTKNDKDVDLDTTKAIEKINNLFQINLHQGEIINSQGKTIKSQSNEISSLEDELKDKAAIILKLKEETKNKEQEIADQQKIIKDLETKILDNEKTINELISYRDNYKKIMDFLGQATEKEENPLKTL